MMVTSGQRSWADRVILPQPLASGRVGLGRRVMENRSSRPNGASIVRLSSFSSRTPTPKAGATKRDRASALSISGS